MCGRFASFRSDEDLAVEFGVEEIVDETPPPSWNVAPTDVVRIIVERKPPGQTSDPGARPMTQLRTARWGLIPGWTRLRASPEKDLVPSWAKDPSIGSRLFNARVEGLATARAFARPFAVRRALLPADGYYEWQQPPDGSAPRTRKQPFYISPADDGPLALAGLYEFWRDPTKAADDPERWLVTAVVVTRPASPDLVHIHDRQPLMLPRPLWEAWLDPAVGADGAAPLLHADPPPLVALPITSAVNNVRNDGPELLEPSA